jgi:hypothetical protein
MERRDLLPAMLGFGAAFAAATGPDAAAAAGARAKPDEGLPQTAAGHLRHLVRMQGSLDEEDVPWWFTGVIFAVAGEGSTPVPLLRFEGMEIYWFQHRPDGYFLGGNTVTFFRDFTTNEYLGEFKNPWTGGTDTVKPAVQGGGLGFKYTERGIWPARYSGEDLGPAPAGPLWVQWHTLGDYVWLQHQTVYPPGVPPMHGQRQSMFVPRREFMRHSSRRLPAAFTSVVFQGWPRWMNMGDRPGHVVWHASGVKIASVAQLPPEYRERAEREYPDRMTARPKN